MTRRNHSKTLLLLLALGGLGWTCYSGFLSAQGMHPSGQPTSPDAVQTLKLRIDKALAEDPSFVEVSALNWRPNQKHYRVDVTLLEGCDKAEVQSISRRVADVVRRETSGNAAEVWCYSLRTR